jgi:hypothetical protein
VMLRYVYFVWRFCRSMLQVTCTEYILETYRAGFCDFQAMGESLTADDGGDLMHELLGISGVC